MEMDLGGAEAAVLGGGSGANRVENWVRSGSRLQDSVLRAPSALQTRRDSPFRQKKIKGSVRICQ